MTYDKYERWHSKASDRQEMRRRISDLRKRESIMKNAPYIDEIYLLLLEMNKWLEKKRKTQTAPELLEDLQPRIKKVVATLKGHPGRNSLV